MAEAKWTVCQEEAQVNVHRPWPVPMTPQTGHSARAASQAVLKELLGKGLARRGATTSKIYFGICSRRGGWIRSQLTDVRISSRWRPPYSISCFSGFVPSAPAQTMLRMTSGSPTPNDQRMPKCSAT